MSKNPDQLPESAENVEDLMTGKVKPLDESGQSALDNLNQNSDQPADSATNLNAAESQAANKAGALSGRNENADSQSIEKGENTSDSGFNYQNPQTAKGRAGGKVKGKTSKKKISTMLILSALGLGGVGVSMFGPHMMLFKLEDVITSKFNYQLASMENSTTKMYHYKIFGGGRTCSGASCKFKGVSDAQLKKFDKAGIGYEVKTVGTKNYIEKLFVPDANGKLDVDGNVKTTTLKADNFSSKIKSDPNLRAQVHKVYKPKFESLTGKVWVNIKNKFNVDKSTTIKKDIDAVKAADTSSKSISQRFRNMETNAKTKLADSITDKLMKYKTFQDIQAKANTELTTGPTKAVGEISSDVFSLSKLGDLKNAAEKVCVIYNTLKIAMYTVKTAQVAAMIPEFVKTMTTISKIKAGEDSTGEEAEALGTLLTKVVKYVGEDQKTRLTLSAMDSFGYKYASYGDLSMSNNDNGSSDIDKRIKDNMRHWMTGGDFFGYMTKDVKIAGINIGKSLNYLSLAASTAVVWAEKAMAQFLSYVTFGTIGSNSSLTQQCRAIRSGKADMIMLGATALELIGECMVGAGAGCLAENIVDMLFGLGKGVIKSVTFATLRKKLYDYIKSFTEEGIGNQIAGSFGDDRGNFLFSSAGLFFGQMSSSAGNGLLTVGDALGYMEEMNEVNIAYAEEDRVTRSPFDISSPNTFMGAIAYDIVPRFASVDGVFSFMSSLSSILSNGLLTPFKRAHADASATAQFEFCNSQNDIFLSKLGSDVAIDPFCNPVFGLTTDQTKNYDPEYVIDEMIKGDYIDDDGEAKEGVFKDFLEDCAGNRTHLFGWDGDVDDESDDINPGANCAAGQEYQGINNVLFYSYIQYQRVNDGMNGDD